MISIIRTLRLSLIGSRTISEIRSLREESRRLSHQGQELLNLAKFKLIKPTKIGKWLMNGVELAMNGDNQEDQEAFTA